MSKKRKGGKGRRILIAFGFIVLLGIISIGADFYYKFYAPNVITKKGEENFLYIPTGTTFTGLINLLVEKKIIRNSETFTWVAQKFNLEQNLHPGKYLLTTRMSNFELVKLIRSGKQTPVKLVLNKFRTKKDFVSFISSKLEIDSNLLINTLNDDVYMRRIGFKPNDVMAMFIPNTYEFYWTTPMETFLSRMQKEYTKFWNPVRMQKAEALKLTPIQVITLASILEEETNHNDEKPEIASVYLNRLHKDMLLQADPTVKFALQNFELKRIWGAYTSYDSPYNTYRYKGLPPGPICTPSTKSIDAVLNARTTDYLYFCASVDTPGYHVFARNYADHEKNAARYQKYLSLQGIR